MLITDDFINYAEKQPLEAILETYEKMKGVVPH